MSGLIWAGLGKGIADAGATFGNAMMRSIEEERRAELEAIREERRTKAKEDADERKAEREAQERIDVAERASTRADELAVGRDAGLIAKVARGVQGDSPAMSEEEIAQLIKENPEYRDTYREAGIIKDAVDPRLQRAIDEEQAVREVGGKATFVEAYAKAKKDVLTQIAAENKEKREAANLDLQTRKTDALIERMGSQNKTDQQKANAATTRANRPPSGGSSGGSADKPISGVDLERAARAAEKDLALALGVPTNRVQETLTRLKKKGSLPPDVQEAADNYKSALTRWRNYKSDDSPPSISGVPKVTTKAEFDKLPRGTRYTAPDGSVRIKQ